MEWTYLARPHLCRVEWRSDRAGPHVVSVLTDFEVETFWALVTNARHMIATRLEEKMVVVLSTAA